MVPTWLGNAPRLRGIADLSTVIGCRDDIMVYLMHAGLEPKTAFTHHGACGKAWLKISEEERNASIQAMKENNVPGVVHRVLWEDQVHVL